MTEKLNSLNNIKQNLMRHTVVLMRGLPGSSKSFTANKLCHNSGVDFVVCSADHYFTSAEGTYAFDRDKLGQAHHTCMEKYIDCLEARIPLVVVDNTNIVYCDMKDYVGWANLAGYDIVLLESQSPWAKDIEECFQRNTHGVPLETIQMMANRYHSNEEVIKFALDNLGMIVKEYPK